MPDRASRELDELMKRLGSYLENHYSEADTRVKFIDPLLTLVLGWDEFSQPADFEHHSFDVRGVLSYDESPVKENVRLEVGLAGLRLPKPADPLFSSYPDHGILPQNSAFQIGNSHVLTPEGGYYYSDTVSFISMPV